MCVADNVASTGEEQIEVLTQSPGATDVKRDVGTAATFYWRIAEQLHPKL